MNEEEPIDPGFLSTLIPRTRDGDEAARSALLSELQDYLTRTANRQIDPSLRQKAAVSDIVQLSFIRIIENFEQFRGENSNQLRAWIKQIVINEANSARRKYHTEKRDLTREKAIKTGPNHTGEAPVDRFLTPSSAAIRAERIEKFNAILSELPDDQATVIRLRSIEQLSFRQVGEAMNRSEEAASQLWYRAIIRFEKALDQIQINVDEP